MSWREHTTRRLPESRSIPHRWTVLDLPGFLISKASVEMETIDQTQSSSLKNTTESTAWLFEFRRLQVAVVRRKQGGVRQVYTVKRSRWLLGECQEFHDSWHTPKSKQRVWGIELVCQMQKLGFYFPAISKCEFHKRKRTNHGKSGLNLLSNGICSSSKQERVTDTTEHTCV